MIPRYNRPEIEKIWSDQNKFKIWTEIECLIAEQLSKLGKIPKQASIDIRSNAKFNVKEIEEIEKKTGKRIAIIISDTFGRPFRLGQTDNAIGVAGIEPILEYEGKPDTFGKILNVTATAIVDELCSAAELVMEKTKKCPMAIIKNYNYVSKDDKISTLIRSESDDLFK